MDQTEVRTFSAGVNQQGVRDHNERLLMSMIQRHGALPGSDLARRAGLSPQTVSVILRGLEQDGFLARGEPQRGRVGKPSIPMELAPEGAFSIGLKIGRRSADLVLTDLLGRVRQHRQITYRYPMPTPILSFLREGLLSAHHELGVEGSARIAGIGIAKPFDIWNWHDAIGAPASDLALWKDIDFISEISRFTNLPIYIENDATAACRAEHVYGRGREFQDFAYFFVGSFVGGGIVLNHSVFEGRHGNAAAFGSLPAGNDGGQLIDAASLYLLERRMQAAGLDPARLWVQPQDWSGFDDILSAWVDATALHLARAALTVCAVIDFEAVLIDGAFPPGVRSALTEATHRAMDLLDTRGISRPRVESGTIGQNARAVGAAAAPVFARFLLNTHGGIASA